MTKGKAARVKIILESTGCDRKSVNKESRDIPKYITQKNRHNTLSQVESREFCPYCYRYTIHGEIKK